MNTQAQEVFEELINAITHGLGVLLILISVPLLLSEASTYGKITTIAAVSLFSFGMLATYLSSTLYHACQRPGLKRICLIADHISIFFMIGGTYTPLVEKYVPHHIAVPFLCTMWGLILAGAILKIFFTGRYEWLSTLFYVFLGWMILFIIEPVSAAMPPHIFWWVIAGGIAYTVGVVFYRMRRPYAHCVWHCFVLVGTILHFTAIYQSIPLQIALR